MEEIFNFLKNILLESNFRLANIPLSKILVVAVIITIFQLLKQFFSGVIISYIETYTSQTETDIDDELIEIIKEPLSWLIFIAGLWFCNSIIAEYLNAKLDKTITGLISLSAVGAIAFVIYRAAPLMGKVLGDLALKTDTQLDDLIVPYLPKLFQTIAILIVFLKTGEVILGASASALIGLLGGTGITLGLLLKDIIYDWFCTIVIYSDRLYFTNDIVVIEGIQGIAKIQDIGLRSTTISIPSRNAIKKIPNSKMITGVLENWSHNYRNENLLAINLTIKIDDITAAQTITICEELRRIPQAIEILSESCKVRFSEIEQNARVIMIQAFVKTNDIGVYNAAKEQFNLAILKLMEQEGIELFSSTPITLLPNNTDNIVQFKAN
ncbi:MAG: mechanosensitive ion channel family protein [Pleurocapsa sp.]